MIQLLDDLANTEASIQDRVETSQNQQHTQNVIQTQESLLDSLITSPYSLFNNSNNSFLISFIFHKKKDRRSDLFYYISIIRLERWFKIGRIKKQPMTITPKAIITIILGVIFKTIGTMTMTICPRP